MAINTTKNSKYDNYVCYHFNVGKKKASPKSSDSQLYQKDSQLYQKKTI